VKYERDCGQRRSLESGKLVMGGGGGGVAFITASSSSG